MALQEFSTSSDLDYARGTRRGWQRQIALVKDADPLGPNYFVIADTLDAKSVPTVWRLFLYAAQITANGSAVTVTGKEDVDMEIIFVRPATVRPVAMADHIEVPVGAEGTLTAVLYPRLKTEPPPKVQPLADGKGVEVETPAGTDYVFLSPTPFTFRRGDIAFDGKVGVVKARIGKRTSSAPGSCAVVSDWPGGDRELRAIPWDGPQYPTFPDE